MNTDTRQTEMRKAIIAGNYREYRYWIAANHAHQRAAPYVDTAQKLLDFDPAVDEIVLVGNYRDNAAYQSAAYRWFIKDNGRVSQVAA